MHLVFDLDGTLVGDEGQLRPGAESLLAELADAGHTLSLWTASLEERALRILDTHEMRRLFAHLVFREDYDPRAKGHPKDIRYLQGDVLVDDDPKQIAFTEAAGGRGVLVPTFAGGRGTAAWRKSVLQALD